MTKHEHETAAESRRLIESGWQKPVVPPKAEARPGGPPRPSAQPVSPSPSKEASNDE